LWQILINRGVRKFALWCQLTYIVVCKYPIVEGGIILSNQKEPKVDSLK